MKTITLFLALFVSLAGYAQFEGRIIYYNKFVSKMPEMAGEQLSAQLGSRQEYFIKGGNYKSVLNGQTITMQLYNSATNRLYNQTANNDTLYWFDAGVNSDSVLSFEMAKGVTTILGYTCDVIAFKTASGITSMYYSSKLGLDAAKFSKHAYGNWALYAARANALPLRIAIENKMFILESTAVEVKAQELKDDVFSTGKLPIKKIK